MKAHVYLALVQNGPMRASAIAAATGLARTAVYPALGALVDKGLAEAGEGYGSRLSPVPAEKALDGGLVTGNVAADGTAALEFRAGGQPGLYRVLPNANGGSTLLQFSVSNSGKS